MKTRQNNESYRQLKRKLFFKTLLMGFGSVFLLFGIYTVWLSGKLANGIVAFFQTFLFMDYDTALNLYERLIRGNIEILFVLAVLIIFFIIFAFYLNWFTKYFYEINRGIDELLHEQGNEITLLPELSETERKLNKVRLTLQKRKTDSQLAEQRKSDLIVYLAHDLKTPLTSVIGYLTLLRDENQISKELQEKYLSISLEKSQRLEDLVNEFFEITRFNLSNIALELRSINLTRMLEQIVYEFKPMLEEKNLLCKLSCAPDITVKLDVDKMQRVFDNLLRNAVNYSFENSEIDINVTLQDSRLKISFINHGNTIPSEKLNRIFEQFYRLDASRTTKSGGAGLGLAIAKEIIVAHGGVISATAGDELITFEMEIPFL